MVRIILQTKPYSTRWEYSSPFPTLVGDKTHNNLLDGKWHNSVLICQHLRRIEAVLSLHLGPSRSLFHAFTMPANNSGRRSLFMRDPQRWVLISCNYHVPLEFFILWEWQTVSSLPDIRIGLSLFVSLMKKWTQYVEKNQDFLTTNTLLHWQEMIQNNKWWKVCGPKEPTD